MYASQPDASVSKTPDLPASTLKLEPIEAAKRLAAYAAVDNHIKPSHKARRSAVLRLSTFLETDVALHHLDCRSSASVAVALSPTSLSASSSRARTPIPVASSSQPVRPEPSAPFPGLPDPPGSRSHPARHEANGQTDHHLSPTQLPSGFQSKALITESGLALGDLESYPRIDVTIDGADECVFQCRDLSSLRSQG